MNQNGKAPQGLDIPIVKLIPRNVRTVSTKIRQRIEASLRAVGLIEPLIVYWHTETARAPCRQENSSDSVTQWILLD